MGKRIFGTDGVRGEANTFLTPELAFSLGRAAVSVISDKPHGTKVLIGRDSRVSGPMLEAAITAGILSVGGDVVKVGVVPTPAVAYLTKNTDVDMGVMISASHNPVQDNGIKFFSKDGFKLPDEVELRIEETIESMRNDDTLPRPVGIAVGQCRADDQAVELYASNLLSSLPSKLDGLKIVCDTGCGAAAPYAQDIFSRAGAEVIMMNDEADGTRINVKCGSTYVLPLQQRVVEEKADMGLAFDGDADRVIAVDGSGNVVNGDTILYVWGKYLKEQGILGSPAIVGTVMTNMGLEAALDKQGMKLLRTKVGDRYVLQQLCADNLILGGEQSGHIIYRKVSSTGDGMLTGLHLAAIVKQAGTTLEALSSELKQYPQALINVRVKNKTATMSDARLIQALEEAREGLGDRGRILVRPSGTEPVIRVMVEAQAEDLAQTWAEKVAQVVENIW